MLGNWNLATKIVKIFPAIGFICKNGVVKIAQWANHTGRLNKSLGYLIMENAVEITEKFRRLSSIL